MKTKYKFIYFKEEPDNEWLICNNKSDVVLGCISYYYPWKQPVFVPVSHSTIFNDSCLLDIVHFIKQLKAA